MTVRSFGVVVIFLTTVLAPACSLYGVARLFLR